MWAETFKYLSVIHNVNHHRRSRHWRGWEKGRERRKRWKKVCKRVCEIGGRGGLSRRQYTDIFVCVCVCVCRRVWGSSCIRGVASVSWESELFLLTGAVWTLEPQTYVVWHFIHHIHTIWHLIDTYIRVIGDFKAFLSTCLDYFHSWQWFPVCQRTSFSNLSSAELWTWNIQLCSCSNMDNIALWSLKALKREWFNIALA